MSRQFFVPADAIQNGMVTLPTELANHIGTVLRLVKGDEILLLDGSGSHYRCIIDRLQRRSGEARIIERWLIKEQAVPICLIQGLPKGNKMEMILQKGTELGIDRFCPVWSERSIPAPASDREVNKQRRWQRIVDEAARQSCRPTLPRCDSPRPLSLVLADCDAELKLMLWEDGNEPLNKALTQLPPREIALLVGPEGGFSSREAELAQSYGFIPVHLGSRILRTETAGFAVSAVLQYLYGDFGAR
ncbi:MAG: 16S rRNA (uracil(1498)-N(3))-methyltransferase [Desulfuromonadales bacterium]|nr:16S rRNA (uracil(1498)-N(3))-methyltransferase [Desulfuromonadales bacterium]